MSSKVYLRKIVEPSSIELPTHLVGTSGSSVHNNSFQALATSIVNKGLGVAKLVVMSDFQYDSLGCLKVCVLVFVLCLGWPQMGTWLARHIAIHGTKKGPSTGSKKIDFHAHKPRQVPTSSIYSGKNSEFTDERAFPWGVTQPHESSWKLAALYPTTLATPYASCLESWQFLVAIIAQHPIASPYHCPLMLPHNTAPLTYKQKNTLVFTRGGVSLGYPAPKAFARSKDAE